MGFEANKPHAVCVPYPLQGHVSPMMQLAQLLHSRGFFISYAKTVVNHRRLIRSKGPDSVEGLPDFRIHGVDKGKGFDNKLVSPTSVVPPGDWPLLDTLRVEFFIGSPDRRCAFNMLAFLRRSTYELSVFMHHIGHRHGNCPRRKA
ncbi:hypothetical protein F3Y22_tig00110330pilonHSYRG00263 [Hibiscus syriacus]|uniref:Uncharacterized protein n=1 Tax=Hibiscus syriacus TaxID=106335 RepID=A0A6A3AXT0_HIBSY|nr:hypothetical protein F3Y22_tig00110330pilonHSYRG00263 [Hibiscus syriacus]